MPKHLPSVVRRLATPAQATWSLSLYASAGEAGGCFVPARRSPAVYVAPGFGKDPERARAEAARRAKTRVRRYCAANGLTRFGTLTYGPPFCREPQQLREDLARFFRRLRTVQGQGPMPYVWVPELHADGERFHAHFGVDRFIPRRRVEETWGHGFIKIKRLTDLPVGSTTWQESRRAAGYLSKYLSKTFTGPQVFGRQRYGVAEGFQPAVVRLTGRSSSDVLGQACAVMRGTPEACWSSSEAEGWRGPPAVWFAWA